MHILTTSVLATIFARTNSRTAGTYERHQRLLALPLLAVTTITVLSAPAALAERRGFARSNGMVNTTGLEPVEMYQAPRRLQIVDPRPIVTNHVRPDRVEPNYVLLGAPDPAGTASGGAASAQTPGGSTFPLGGIPISGGGPQGVRRSIPGVGPLGGLDHSEFGTNIPSSGIQPRTPLADGTTTNRLSGRVAPPQQVNQPALVFHRSEAPTRGNALQPNHVARYTPYNSQGTGSSNGTINARGDVFGQLLQKNLAKKSTPARH